MAYLNDIEIKKWFANKGDYTHNITYDLNENSIIMDLGGYTGVWAQQMIDKYNPNVYIIEPVTKFYDIMVTKFSNNNKVYLMNVGVGTENKDSVIFMNGDGTSSNLNNGESINVKFKTIEDILQKWELNKVDLIQINIEGDEYPVLEKMIETGIINRFKNIQVQFHLGIKNDIERREIIRKGLKQNGFEINFDYPFVWESWKQK
jgi:FkbM family methyltransferase